MLCFISICQISTCSLRSSPNTFLTKDFLWNFQSYLAVFPILQIVISLFSVCTRDGFCSFIYPPKLGFSKVFIFAIFFSLIIVLTYYINYFYQVVRLVIPLSNGYSGRLERIENSFCSSHGKHENCFGNQLKSVEFPYSYSISASLSTPSCSTTDHPLLYPLMDSTYS